MKKMILTLAIALTTIGAFATETTVSSRVLGSFGTDFKAAKEVSWTAGNNFYKAAFVLNNQHMFAFYSTEGELLGLTRYISSLDLPINLQKGLKKSYADFWIADLFEVTNTNGTGYYLTIEDADTKIVLQSQNGEDWSVYQKAVKA